MKQVCTWQWFGGLYKDEDRDRSKFFPRFGVEADRFFDVYPDYHVPFAQKLAFKRDIASAMLGQTLAKKLGLKLGDKIKIKGNIFPFDLDLTVRAIYDSELDADNLYLPIKYLEEALKARGSNRSYAGTFTSLVDTPDDVPRVSTAIDQMFSNAEEPTHTESEYAFGLSFLSFLGNIKLALMSICGAVTFTILLVAGNTMAMSVRERVREVGILKTLGFTPGMVIGLLLGESGVISLLGGGLGLLLANGLIGVLRHGPAIVQQTKTLTLQPPVLVDSRRVFRLHRPFERAGPRVEGGPHTHSGGPERRGLTTSLRRFHNAHPPLLQPAEPRSPQDYHGDDSARHRADGCSTLRRTLVGRGASRGLHLIGQCDEPAADTQRR